jgi:hypothetical protein
MWTPYDQVGTSVFGCSPQFGNLGYSALTASFDTQGMERCISDPSGCLFAEISFYNNDGTCGNRTKLVESPSDSPGGIAAADS